MGREEEGGFRMGNTGIPVVDSFRYLAKLIHIVKFKNKIKLKRGKKKKEKYLLEELLISLFKGIFKNIDNLS